MGKLTVIGRHFLLLCAAVLGLPAVTAAQPTLLADLSLTAILYNSADLVPGRTELTEEPIVTAEKARPATCSKPPFLQVGVPVYALINHDFVAEVPPGTYQVCKFVVVTIGKRQSQLEFSEYCAVPVSLFQLQVGRDPPSWSRGERIWLSHCSAFEER